MITILAKVALRFANPDKDVKLESPEKFVTVGRDETKDVPDWVKQDPIFKWAFDDGNLLVLRGREETAAELVDALEPPPSSAPEGSAPAAKPPKRTNK